MVNKEDIIKLYVVERISPDDIAKIYGVSGRTIRNWLHKHKVELLGPSHLRAGKSAVWNVGNTLTDTTKAKISLSLKGKTAWNKGRGDWVRFECQVCNCTVTRRPYRNIRYCSKDCMSKATGESHFNFTGKESRGLQTKRSWKQYREFKKAVHVRDKNKCRICLEHGSRQSRRGRTHAWPRNQM